MWQQRLNTEIFPDSEETKIYSDCRPGFLCINLGQQEEEAGVEASMEQFFQAARQIRPRQRLRELRCQTHTMSLKGQCWVLCDQIKLWRCHQPMVRMVAPEEVRSKWRWRTGQ